MDNCNEIIDNTLIKLSSFLNEEQLHIVHEVLSNQLVLYDIEKKTDELGNESSNVILERFLATKRLEGKSEKTLEQYKLRCSQMLEAIPKKLDKITTYDLRIYLINYQHDKGISNRTLDNIRRCLSSFFSWAFNEGLITTNPAAGVNAIKYEKEVQYPFTSTEIEKLRGACKNKRDRALLEFFYATGCRVSEVALLNKADIDWNTKEVVVHGKGNKQRTVFLNETAIFYLQEYLKERTDSDPCLFLSKTTKADGSRYLTKNGIEKMFRTLGAAAGVEDVHPHRFRRTFATNMINKGAPIQEVAAILGHEDIDTTMIYYHDNKTNTAYVYNKYMA